jgi:hypothetical protein
MIIPAHSHYLVIRVLYIDNDTFPPGTPQSPHHPAIVLIHTVMYLQGPILIKPLPTFQWWANLDQAPKDLDKTIFRDLSPTPKP